MILFKTKNSLLFCDEVWHTKHALSYLMLFGICTCHAVVWGVHFLSSNSHPGLRDAPLWQHVILQDWEEEKLWESSTELSAETYTVTL